MKFILTVFFALLMGVSSVSAQIRVFADLPYSQAASPFGGTVDLFLDLYQPAAVPVAGDSLIERGPRPVVVLCHAGSYVSGDKREFRRLGAEFARRGIAAIAMDYRLGTVPDASDETTAVSMVYADVLAVFGWIAAHAGEYNLDPDRVYISGGSSGGHMTIATGVLYPREKTNPVHLRGAIGMYGGYFTQDIRSDATPLLIIQGTADKSCLPDASRYMARLYHDAGAWCRMLLVEGMVHDWGGDRYMDKILMRIEEFIRQTSAPNFSQNSPIPTNQPEETYLPAETIETVSLAGGKFNMGNDIGEINERPAHQVNLSPYRIGRTEVTVAQFRCFVAETGYRTDVERFSTAWVLDLTKSAADIHYYAWQPSAFWDKPFYPQNDGFPAVLVSWNDCAQFCNWLSKRDGLPPAYRFEGDHAFRISGSKGWRLPTEAEFEFAARQVWHGKPVRLEDLYTTTGKTVYNPRALPAPCLSAGADRGGFHFLFGNAGELCEDWYNPYVAGKQVDPLVMADSGQRVMRGGGWYQNWYTEVLEPTIRWHEMVDDAIFSYMGFRVVRSE